MGLLRVGCMEHGNVAMRHLQVNASSVFHMQSFYLGGRKRWRKLKLSRLSVICGPGYHNFFLSATERVVSETHSKQADRTWGADIAYIKSSCLSMKRG